MAQPIWASEILPPQHTPAKNRLVFPCVSVLHASYWVIMVTPKIFFNNSLSLGVALREGLEPCLHHAQLVSAPSSLRHGPPDRSWFYKVITWYNPINYSCYSSAINPGFWSELNQLSRYCLEASPRSFSPWSSWSAPPYGLPKKNGDGKWLPHMATLTGKLCLLSHGICLRLVPRFSEKTHQTRGNSMASNLILPTFCQPFSEETTINHTSTPQKMRKMWKPHIFPPCSRPGAWLQRHRSRPSVAPGFWPAEASLRARERCPARSLGHFVNFVMVSWHGCAGRSLARKMVIQWWFNGNFMVIW